MEQKKIGYCFILTPEQLEFLSAKKYNVDRMECFICLVRLATAETKIAQARKCQQVEILPGQVMASNSELAKLWGKDRKTVPKILEAMADAGISSTQLVGECRIHTLHPLSGWYVDGKFAKNDFGNTLIKASSQITHGAVPPARVFSLDAEGAKAENSGALGERARENNPAPGGQAGCANQGESDTAKHL